MGDKKKVPKIRFPEFTEEWERCKLGDVVDVYDGVHQTPSDTKSAVMFLSVENIKTLQSDKYISEADFNNDYKVYPQKGDVLMTRIGDVGTPNVYTSDEKVAFYVSLALLKPKIVDSWFLCNSILAPKFKRNLKKRTLVTAVPQKINKDEIGKIDIIVPPSNSEQRSIGELFMNLDNLITLHQRKVDHIKLLKKSMLQRIFPRNGAKQPEARFPGFTDDWEQRKLGEIVEITMGQSPDGATYSETQADYILIQGNADLKDGWVYPRVWTTQKTKTAEAGDLIMSVRAPAGTMGKTSYNAVIGRGVASIKGNEFIFQTLNKMDADGYWRRLSAGSTFESLNSDSIKNAEIMVPTTQEQVQIGNIFQNLDNLITLHQREAEHLKLLKKGMLQKMFV